MGVHACACVGVGARASACDSVRVALLIQYVTRKRYVLLFLTSDATVFFDIILKTARFSEESCEYKMCIFIFSTNFIRNIFILRRI